MVQIASYVYQQLQQGFAVEIMSSPNSASLVHAHAYAVVAVARDSTGALFVEVRNPWGTVGSTNAQPFQWINANELLRELGDVVIARP